MYGLPASDRAPFFGSQRSPVLVIGYMTDTHFYLQTSMTILIPPLIPPLVACLCLSFNHIPTGSHLVLLQGGSSVRH